MSDCCANNLPKTAVQDCPLCGISCRSVGIKTLYHQVKFPENQKIHSDAYYYCPAKTCTAGYFSTAGSLIPKRLLRSALDIQEGTLCYCFNISEAQYRLALQADTAASIKNFVIEQTASGTCACEITNPSGRCCLAAFKRLEKEIARNDSAP